MRVVDVYLIAMCSKYDLYSKSKVRIDVEKVKPYYLSLIDKVCHRLIRNCSTLICTSFAYKILLQSLFVAVLPLEAEVVMISWRMIICSIIH